MCGRPCGVSVSGRPCRAAISAPHKAASRRALIQPAPRRRARLPPIWEFQPRSMAPKTFRRARISARRPMRARPSWASLVRKVLMIAPVELRPRSRPASPAGATTPVPRHRDEPRIAAFDQGRARRAARGLRLGAGDDQRAGAPCPSRTWATITGDRFERHVHLGPTARP